MIEQIGFVQVDSINTVERAHHMTLFARNQTYQRAHLTDLLEQDRELFENWTHDAAIIPTRFYPMWLRHFERHCDVLRARWQKWRRDGFEATMGDVLAQVSQSGPAMSRALASDEKKGGDGWWDWHPSKTALEYLWRTGQLAVTRREGFQKVYDLSERVIPDEHRRSKVDDDELIDWCCRSALERLGIATSGELAAFWGIITAVEAKQWCERHAGSLQSVMVEACDGTRPREALAEPSVLELGVEDLAPPPRLRVISPFDPVVRDRKRLMRLFGFDYRIEVFVPAQKRQYGYYVFPLLEGDRFVGRIDMKCDRRNSVLEVANVWWEPNVRRSKGRLKKLEAELDRVGRFAGCPEVRFRNSN